MLLVSKYNNIVNRPFLFWRNIMFTCNDAKLQKPMMFLHQVENLQFQYLQSTIEDRVMAIA